MPSLQEVVRQAITSLFEATEQQSERIAELELGLKQKCNKEDVGASLTQKASTYELNAAVKKACGHAHIS